MKVWLLSSLVLFTLAILFTGSAECVEIIDSLPDFVSSFKTAMQSPEKWTCQVHVDAYKICSQLSYSNLAADQKRKLTKNLFSLLNHPHLLSEHTFQKNLKKMAATEDPNEIRTISKALKKLLIERILDILIVPDPAVVGVTKEDLATLFAKPHQLFKNLFQEAYATVGSQHYTAFHAFLKQDVDDPYTKGLEACNSYTLTDPFDYHNFKEHLDEEMEKASVDSCEKPVPEIMDEMDQLFFAYTSIKKESESEEFFDQAKSFLLQHKFRQFLFTDAGSASDAAKGNEPPKSPFLAKDSPLRRPSLAKANTSPQLPGRRKGGPTPRPDLTKANSASKIPNTKTEKSKPISP